MTVRSIGGRLWTGDYDCPEDLIVVNIKGNIKEVMGELEDLEGCGKTVLLASAVTPGFFADAGTIGDSVVHLVDAGDSLVFGIPDGKTAVEYGDLMRSVAGAMGKTSVKVADRRTSELVSYILAIRGSMDRALKELASSLIGNTGASADAVKDILEIADTNVRGNSGIEALMTDNAPALVDGVRRSDAEMRQRFIDGVMSDGTREIGFLDMDESVVRNMAKAVRRNGGKCFQIGTGYKGIKALDHSSEISDVCRTVISPEETDLGDDVRIILWE